MVQEDYYNLRALFENFTLIAKRIKDKGEGMMDLEDLERLVRRVEGGNSRRQDNPEVV